MSIEKNTTIPASHSEVEHIKSRSNYLRGTIKESLKNELTGAVHKDDTKLIKFHGSYQQHDRDLESERKKQKLEPLYSFMIRVRLAGGVVKPEQWINMDELSSTFGNNTLKLTTRQAFQLHGISKQDLQPVIAGFNEVLLDSIAGCGDVNRNVMCNPNPYQSLVHAEVLEDATEVSATFTPKTSAYWELWLDGKPIEKGSPLLSPPSSDDQEPIYGKQYLPRKFKIAFAIPPNNDTDIFANDIGLVAIEENGSLIGYNLAIGGGLGMTFGMPETYPRLAEIIGFVERKNLLTVIESIITIQRDWGNREDRKFSRLKYTLDKVGTYVFKKEIELRSSFALLPAKSYNFTSSGDSYGWSKNTDGTWNYTLFVEGGRVADGATYHYKTALRTIAELCVGEFRLTGNQNLMLIRIPDSFKNRIHDILVKNKIETELLSFSGLRLNSIACVALNTCSLAFAEAERYLPSLIDKIDLILKANHLEKEAILIRMTGCPNGCGRPYLGEIGLIGRSLGRYNLYLGASHNGERMNKLYKEYLNEEEILETLSPIIESYAKEKTDGEHFGDYVIRKGIVKPTTHGLNFHD